MESTSPVLAFRSIRQSSVDSLNRLLPKPAGICPNRQASAQTGRLLPKLEGFCPNRQASASTGRHLSKSTGFCPNWQASGNSLTGKQDFLTYCFLDLSASHLFHSSSPLGFRPAIRPHFLETQWLPSALLCVHYLLHQTPHLSIPLLVRFFRFEIPNSPDFRGVMNISQHHAHTGAVSEFLLRSLNRWKVFVCATCESSQVSDFWNGAVQSFVW